MSAHSTLAIEYDGPEANSILRRSASQLTAAHRLAMSIPGFPESRFNLERLLCRVPSFPDDIPSSSIWIEGYSTWESRDTSCPLRFRTEKRDKLGAHKFYLRSMFPTICKVSTSDNFRIWEGKANNGLALLVLGCAYVLTASLAERQHLALQYKPRDSPSGSVKINLDYASPQELGWWKTIMARGSAYSIPASDEHYCSSQWAVQVDNFYLEIVGYLARLCVAYDLGSQCSAALAAALSLPLGGDLSPASIELPLPSLSMRLGTPGESHYLTDFGHLGRYMTLSLSQKYGTILWSVFMEPNVPCNFVGAWLGPIADVLRPIIEENNLGTSC